MGGWGGVFETIIAKSFLPWTDTEAEDVISRLGTGGWVAGQLANKLCGGDTSGKDRRNSGRTGVQRLDVCRVLAGQCGCHEVNKIDVKLHTDCS